MILTINVNHDDEWYTATADLAGRAGGAIVRIRSELGTPPNSRSSSSLLLSSLELIDTKS